MLMFPNWWLPNVPDNWQNWDTEARNWPTDRRNATDFCEANPTSCKPYAIETFATQAGM